MSPREELLQQLRPVSFAIAYPLGVRVSDRELAAVPLQHHGWHREWTYTVLPDAA